MTSEFSWWRGASGAWWLHTPMPISAGFHLDRPATYVIARAGERGAHTALLAGETTSLAETWLDLRREGLLDEAWELGGEWLHVHLVSWTSQQRSHVAEDIVRWHRPALNLRALAGGAKASRVQRDR